MCLDTDATQLALDIVEGAAGLLLERGGAINHHDLGRVNATNENCGN